MARKPMSSTVDSVLPNGTISVSQYSSLVSTWNGLHARHRDARRAACREVGHHYVIVSAPDTADTLRVCARCMQIGDD
jgi:hypothetical protein